jgi:hypothetical protein
MKLTNISDVLVALGGPTPVSKMLGLRRNAPLMWRKRKTLPPRTYVALQEELGERGHTAPPRLWGMYERRPNGKLK